MSEAKIPVVSGLYEAVRPPFLQRVPPWVRALMIVGVLYAFLVSIKLMGGGFKSIFKGEAEGLLENATQNPFVGLFLGILATSIVQSSSATTSIIVGLVAAGKLPVYCAIPIIMGANIGTTVTNTIVSLGFLGRKQEFRRSFACGTVHDFFNYLCVAIMLPVELICRKLAGSGPLQWVAEKLTVPLQATALFPAGTDGKAIKKLSPISMVVKPTAGKIKEVVKAIFGSGDLAHWAVVIISLVLLFAALWAVTKLMRSLMLSKLEVAIDRTIGRNAGLGLVVGVIFTAIVQSSSVTTSILVPLAAAGIINVHQAFPVTVGANIGTTATALLAALAGGNAAGLTIALVHLLFNTVGALLFVPFGVIREIPVKLAEGLAGLVLKSRWYAIIYVLTLFFLIPILLFVLTRKG